MDTDATQRVDSAKAVVYDRSGNLVQIHTTAVATPLVTLRLQGNVILETLQIPNNGILVRQRRHTGSIHTHRWFRTSLKSKL